MQSERNLQKVMKEDNFDANTGNTFYRLAGLGNLWISNSLKRDSVCMNGFEKVIM